jgi:HAD superfamily hydrolase (TIGR01509 family)
LRSLQKQKIQALFFDFDGVLFDLEPLHFKAWELTLEKLGYQDSSFSLENVIGISDKEIADHFINVFSISMKSENLQEEKELNYDYLISDVQFPAKELQDILKKYRQSFKLLIVSSSTTSAIKKILDRCNLANYFFTIIGADKVQNHKPHPEPYQMALEACSISADQAVAVEDSVAGLRSAQDVGISAIWFKKYQHTPPSEYQNSFPSISHLSELELFIQ